MSFEWIKHNLNVRHCPEMQSLIRRYGLEGYGRYWALLETIAEAGGVLEIQDHTFESLATVLEFEGPEDELGVKEAVKFIDFLTSRNLIQSNKETSFLASDSVQEDLDLYQKKIKAGRKGGKASSKSKQDTKDTYDQAELKQCSSSAQAVLKQSSSSAQAELKQCSSSAQAELKQSSSSAQHNTIQDKTEQYRREYNPPNPPSGERGKSKENKGKEESFNAFWDTYPKQYAKPEALRAWKALSPNAETTEKIMKGLTAWKNAEQWTRDSGRFIPAPSRFISQRLWETKPQKEKNNYQKHEYTDDLLEGFIQYAFD